MEKINWLKIYFLSRSVLHLSTERPSGKFFHKIMWQMLTVGPISDLFWAQNLKFCSRDFFSKKTRNFAFFSFYRGERIFCKKSKFSIKTRWQMWFSMMKKIKNVYSTLSKKSKNRKNELFFTHLARGNGFSKIGFLRSQLIIFRTNYEKNCDFVRFFQ